MRRLLLVVLLSSLAAPALAAPKPVVTLRSATGLRHSSLAGPGLTLRLGGDVYATWIGLGATFEWTNDRTFAKVENRSWGRSTTWLNVAGRIPVNRTFNVEMGFGGGLGWIRRAGEVERWATEGFHEYVRATFTPSGQPGLWVGFQGEGQHLWQGGSPAASPDHAFVLIVTSGLNF